MTRPLLLTRRAALLGLTSAFTLGRASLALAAAPTDRRFVVVILRGALDGLAAVVPYGDPALAGHRAELVPGAVGSEAGMIDLGGFYGLHPALPGIGAMYRAGEALPIHAVAGTYRTRSHFEAQDYLESGADQRMTSGWLNRAVAVMPGAASQADLGLAVGLSLPLLMRGPMRIGSWAPNTAPSPNADLYAKLVALHHADPVTGPAITEGLQERGFTAAVLSGGAPPTPGNNFATLAGSAGRLLAAADGPRIAALEAGGWDTHVAQEARLHAALKQLDAGLVALKAGMGDAWRKTVVLVMTEFGRTVRVNGTKGTDHGTGTVAFLLGGAVAGGRVQADWPGLAENRLFENRDLQPTTDLRGIAKGVLTSHLNIPTGALATIFPADPAPPARGLVRA